MFPESLFYDCPEACHTFWVRGRIEVEDVAGSEEASCHDYDGDIYAVLESEVAGVLTGEVQFWASGLFHHSEQVLEQNNRRTPLPATSCVLLSDVGYCEATEPGHPSQGGKINLGWLQVSPGAILQARREVQSAELHSQGC